MADDAARGRQAEELAFAIEMLVQASALDTDGSAYGIHPCASHRREVDDHPTFAHRMAGDGMGAAAHGHKHVVLARKQHGGDHVGHALAPRDERGTPVDIRVPDLARHVVARIVWADQLAKEVLLKREARHGKATPWPC